VLVATLKGARAFTVRLKGDGSVKCALSGPVSVQMHETAMVPPGAVKVKFCAATLLTGKTNGIAGANFPAPPQLKDRLTLPTDDVGAWLGAMVMIPLVWLVYKFAIHPVTVKAALLAMEIENAVGVAGAL
jgi:hypothetical protein